MSRVAFFIDLPNYYSRLLKAGGNDTKTIKDYFIHWLDFDILAKYLSHTYIGIWVFYSGNRLGPSGDRIEGEYLNEYIKRINALEGVTAYDVNIPGEQREPYYIKCEECGHEAIAEARSEKGIDASLSVHLFDTLEAWDIAYLLSGDADYVPVIRSLRRRGKIINVAGFSDASPAIIQESFKFINLFDEFHKHDLFAFKVFKQGSIVDKWLNDSLYPNTDFAKENEIELRFIYVEEDLYGGNRSTPRHPGSYLIHLGTSGAIDLESRLIPIKEILAENEDNVDLYISEDGKAIIEISDIKPFVWEGAFRRLGKLLYDYLGDKYLKKLPKYSLYCKYKINKDTDEYEFVKID